jgi:hypothetical protein
MVTRGGQSNDYYLVANNGFLDRPEARPLFDDLTMFPEYLDASKTAGQVFFWFGPAGTVTPLHHDVMNMALPFLGAESVEFGGFRAAKDFLWLTAGKSARWTGRREELVAKDGHGQHHHRHRSA